MTYVEVKPRRGPKTLPGLASGLPPFHPKPRNEWPEGVDPTDPRCPECRGLLWTPDEECEGEHENPKGDNE